MATFKHTKVSTVPDGDDATQVQPSDWNADHEITLSGPGLLGKSTAGAGSVSEISLGSGLVFNTSSVDVQTKTINGDSILGGGNIELATAAQVDLKVDKASGQSLILDAERIKLAGIQAGAQVNVATNLAQGARTSTGIPLTSSTGTGTTLPVATTTFAGLQSAADKAKLDGIAAGAQVNSVTSVAGKTGYVLLVKADVGLSNADNTSDLNKPVSTAQQTALNLKANLASPVFTGTPTAPTQDAVDNSTKIATTEFVKNVVNTVNSGVISVTGDAPVTITGTASNPVIGVSNATTSTSGAMSAADKTKLNGIAAGAQVNTVTSVAGKTGAISLVKADVGLSNVDNTSDLNKPVSAAQQSALNEKVDKAVGQSLMLDAERTKLSGIAAGAQVNVATNLAQSTRTATTVLVTSSTGTNATLSAATTTQAGVMASADKTKLDGIAAGAQVNTVNSVAGKTGAISLVKADVGLGNVDNTSDLNKPVSTATQTALDNKLGVAATAAAAQKLATARTINGVAFDGTANIVTDADWTNVTNKPDTYAPSAHTHVISEVTGLQGALDGKLGSTATASAATKLATARTIGGVSFDGTASINLPGVNTAGNQSTTGNAATATKLATSRTISATGDATWSTSFDGSANATGALTLANSGVTAGSYPKVTVDEKGRVTAGTALLASDVPTLNQNTTGNATTATRLQTARTIGGVSFNGTANINLPGVNAAGNQNTTGNAATATKLATSRTVALTGDVTGSATFDGSANVTITATVQDDSHNHVIGNVDGLQAALDNKVGGTGPSGAALLPGGTQAQRPASPVNGMFRYNSEKHQFEGYQDGKWGQIGGGDAVLTPGWTLSRNNIGDGYAAQDGQLLSRATYPDAWAQAQAIGMVITDAEWLADPLKRGFFSSGNGSTTFRLPDANGKQAGSLGAVFMRGDGALGAGQAGLIQRDAMQQLVGTIPSVPRMADTTLTGVFSTDASANPSVDGFTYTTGATRVLKFDSANSPSARTASETRALNLTVVWTIKLFGAVVNVGSADASQLASDYANLAGRVGALEMLPKPFALEYHSGPQTITTGGGLTFTHNFGRLPKLDSARLECVTAEGGYAVGDMVGIGYNADIGSAVARGYSLRLYENTAALRFGTSGFTLINANTGAVITITPANWRIHIGLFA